ncbi:hypothetical protein Bca4012_007929 [Brassica carinata]
MNRYSKAIKCFVRRLVTEGNRNRLFKADDSLAGYMLLSCSVQLDFKRSSFTLRSLAGLKENQKKQRHDDNVFAIYPQMDGKGTATGGHFKADDSPAGYMLLPCSVQLGTLEKL